jgi:hypothetical protein
MILALPKVHHTPFQWKKVRHEGHMPVNPAMGEEHGIRGSQSRPARKKKREILSQK